MRLIKDYSKINLRFCYNIVKRIFEVRRLIKEIIVVEGKDDITAVKKAVDAEVIAVHGFGLNQKSIDLIKKASENRGIIILTDPDYAGEQIRKRITKIVPDAKQAYIMREEGNYKGNIGVENADIQSIRRALENVHAESSEKREEFKTADLMNNGLIGKADSSERRKIVCSALRIGYCNSNNLLKRLNNYGISREEFEKALEGLKEI